MAEKWLRLNVVAPGGSCFVLPVKQTHTMSEVLRLASAAYLRASGRSGVVVSSLSVEPRHAPRGGGQAFLLPADGVAGWVLRDDDFLIAQTAAGALPALAAAPAGRRLAAAEASSDEDTSSEEAAAAAAAKPAKPPVKRVSAAAMESLYALLEANGRARAFPNHAEAEALAAEVARSHPSMRGVINAEKVQNAAQKWRKKLGVAKPPAAAKPAAKPGAAKAAAAKPPPPPPPPPPPAASDSSSSDSGDSDSESDSETEEEAQPPASQPKAAAAAGAKRKAAQADTDEEDEEEEEEEEEEGLPSTHPTAGGVAKTPRK